ncbi:MAG: glycosyltransferase family 2 protein [Thermoplasmata archaeon]|nr:glycosyltransferase family 2 protein [Thermoplasmata archaeon]
MHGVSGRSPPSAVSPGFPHPLGRAPAPLPAQPPRVAPNPRGPPLILLPTLNEELGLRLTLDDLASVTDFSNGRAPDVLVVDGHSTDQTCLVAQELRARVLMQEGRGKGSAVLEGLHWAVDHGYGSVVVLDADGTYPCDRLPVAIALLESDAEVVAGVRHPVERPTVRGAALVHRVGNGLLNFCAGQFSGGPILDVCTGFWGVRVEVLPELDLRSTGFEVESELFVKAMRRRLRVIQIPVEYRPRVGEAKLHAVRDGARILLSILRHSAQTPVPPKSVVTGTASASRRSMTPLAQDLTTLLCSLPATSFLVLSGSARYPEAIEVARTVERRRPSVQISARIVSPGAAEGPSERAPPASEEVVAASTVVVTLPDAPADATAPGSALVSVPPARRTLVLEEGDPDAPASTPENFSISGYLRTRGILRPSPLLILGAMLDTSGLQKELALVAANASSTHVRVSPAPRGIESGSEDEGPPPRRELERLTSTAN